MFEKMKNKTLEILRVTLAILLITPCDFYPFAYIKTDGDMNARPLAFWVLGKLYFLLWDVVNKLIA